jgi:hypothetical protein
MVFGERFANLEKKLDSKLDYFSHYYIYIIYFTYFLYTVLFVGIISINYEYLRLFSAFIQLFIGIFLVIRFNPFRNQYNQSFKEEDKRIIFSSGLFLLINLSSTELIIYFYDNIYKKLNNLNLNILDKHI